MSGFHCTPVRNVMVLCRYTRIVRPHFMVLLWSIYTPIWPTETSVSISILLRKYTARNWVISGKFWHNVSLLILPQCTLSNHKVYLTFYESSNFFFTRLQRYQYNLWIVGYSVICFLKYMIPHKNIESSENSWAQWKMQILCHMQQNHRTQQRSTPQLTTGNTNDQYRC